MKLSSQAVDQILHVIATFDRERGVPHDYVDLETVLRQTELLDCGGGELAIAVAGADTGTPAVAGSPVPIPAEATETAPAAARHPAKVVLNDSVEAKQAFLAAARGWRGNPQ